MTSEQTDLLNILIISIGKVNSMLIKIDHKVEEMAKKQEEMNNRLNALGVL